MQEKTMNFLNRLMARPSLRKTCRCMQSKKDGLFYCFRLVQGEFEECSGPYHSIEECENATKGTCD